jgi:hypothetical protein
MSRQRVQSIVWHMFEAGVFVAAAVALAVGLLLVR